jgi:hypothetical protein
LLPQAKFDVHDVVHHCPPQVPCLHCEDIVHGSPMCPMFTGASAPPSCGPPSVPEDDPPLPLLMPLLLPLLLLVPLLVPSMKLTSSDASPLAFPTA